MLSGKSQGGAQTGCRGDTWLQRDGGGSGPASGQRQPSTQFWNQYSPKYETWVTSFPWRSCNSGTRGSFSSPWERSSWVPGSSVCIKGRTHTHKPCVPTGNRGGWTVGTPCRSRRESWRHAHWVTAPTGRAGLLRASREGTGEGALEGRSCGLGRLLQDCHGNRSKASHSLPTAENQVYGRFSKQTSQVGPRYTRSICTVPWGQGRAARQMQAPQFSGFRTEGRKPYLEAVRRHSPPR